MVEGMEKEMENKNTMSEFKIGDRVRVLKDLDNSEIKAGSLGVISEYAVKYGGFMAWDYDFIIRLDEKYVTDYEGPIISVYSHEIEKVTPANISVTSKRIDCERQHGEKANYNRPVSH